MAQIARSKLPSDIYAVPVTISVLVDARGTTEAERIEDAKVQAAKWAGKATKTVGEPTQKGLSHVCP
jgi:hypothetical protein